MRYSGSYTITPDMPQGYIEDTAKKSRTRYCKSLVVAVGVRAMVRRKDGTPYRAWKAAYIGALFPCILTKREQNA